MGWVSKITPTGKWGKEKKGSFRVFSGSTMIVADETTKKISGLTLKFFGGFGEDLVIKLDREALKEITGFLRRVYPEDDEVLKGE